MKQDIIKERKQREEIIEKRKTLLKWIDEIKDPEELRNMIAYVFVKWQKAQDDIMYFKQQLNEANAELFFRRNIEKKGRR